MVGILCVSVHIYVIMDLLPSCNVTVRRKYPEVRPNGRRTDHWHVSEGTLDMSIFQSFLLLSDYNKISILAQSPTFCLDILPTALK